MSQAAPATESEVQDLVNRWLAAQNSGDFVGYSQLYAAHFEGTRRSGARVVRLDRAGWMRDRKRMFKGAVRVELDTIRIAVGGQSASITFSQSWESSHYKDVGTKRLVALREGRNLRIAREDMLTSEVTQAALASEAFAFVVAAGVPSIVIDREPHTDWLTGPARLVGHWVARRPLAPDRLPPEIRRWEHRRVRLYDLHGPVCVGTVSGFAAAAIIVPHWAQVEEWEGRGAYKGQKAVPDERVAESVWSLAGADTYVTAYVTVNAGHCGQAEWARWADLPRPRFAKMEQASGPLRVAALDVLAKNANESAGPRPQRPGTVNTTVVTGPAGGRLMWVSSRGEGDVDQEEPSVAAIFEVQDGRQGLTLVRRPIPGYAAPLAAVDVDGDGELEWIVSGERSELDRGLFHLVGGGYGAVHLTVPYYDCDR